MDFTLLYAVKGVTKNTCSRRRIALAAAAGACFAVVYPLMGIESALAQVALKLVSGAAMCAVGGRFSRFSGYIKFTALFMAATFVVGGALIALFSLTGAQYAQGGGYLGGGYLVSSVPVGIPLFAALIFFLAVRRAALKFMSAHCLGTVRCRVTVGDRVAECPAFYDSGNRVRYGGVPVSVAPVELAQKLTDVESIKSCVEIHTVSGRAKLPVFRADSVEIDDGRHRRTLSGVLIGVSPQRIQKLVLSPDLAEVN